MTQYDGIAVTDDIRTAQSYAALEQKVYRNRARLVVAIALAVSCVWLIVALPLGAAHLVTGIGFMLLLIRYLYGRRDIRESAERYRDRVSQDPSYRAHRGGRRPYEE